MLEFVKKNWKWLLVVVIVLYTALVSFISISIYKTYLANQFKNAFSEAFNTTFSGDDKEANKKNDVSSENKKIATKPTDIGQTIYSQDWEITFKGTEFSQDVKPPKTSGFYTHYQVDDTSSTYLVSKFDIKNVSEISLDGEDSVELKAYYDNKYEYTGFSVIVDKDNEGFSSYESVAPLTTRTLYYLTEMPKEITEDDKPIKIQFSISDEVYEYTI